VATGVVSTGECSCDADLSRPQNGTSSAIPGRERGRALGAGGTGTEVVATGDNACRADAFGAAGPLTDEGARTGFCLVGEGDLSALAVGAAEVASEGKGPAVTSAALSGARAPMAAGAAPPVASIDGEMAEAGIAPDSSTGT